MYAAAGFAVPWFQGKKTAIGVGMIPRGEVGLIFAQMGLASGVFDAKLFSAVTMTVMGTTLIAHPLLRALFSSPDPAWVAAAAEDIEELVTGE
jgi:Kef-type K+ transport system membrane component KefB